MNATQSTTAKGRKVEEYYWAGAMVVYVDNYRVTTDYPSTVADIEAGREPKFG